MHSQSMCDCYCKTGASATRQRDEIHTERSRGRSTKIVPSKFLKSESSRSVKRIPLTPAKVIDNEQLDTKRSTVTFPVSPILSPETSAVLEDVEKLIKDAQIQMKEISMATSTGRFRNHVNLYPQEASLDDENDQLLYIRERVASKFQESNVSPSDSKNRRKISNENCPTMKPNKILELTGPKFQTLEDRWKGYSRQKQLETEKIEFLTTSQPDQQLEKNNKTKNQTFSGFQEIRQNKKMNACKIQAGPSVDIKGELRVQNLANIHISPDVSFVKENENVATYIVYRDFEKGNVSPKRREKCIKILENDDNDDSDKKLTMKERTKKRNSQNWKENQENSNSVKILEKSNTVPKMSDDISIKSNETLSQNGERLNESAKTVRTIFLNEKFEGAFSSKIENDLKNCSNVDGKLENENGESMEDVSSIKPDVEEKTSVSMKIVRKNEQKQVRFDERILETGNDENFIETGNIETIATNLEGDLEISRKSNDSKANENISKNNSERVKNSSFSEEIEKKRVENKKKQKEIREKRKTERYERIDERFENILRNFARQNDEYSKINTKINDTNTISSTSFDSMEDSEDFDELCNFYEPCTKELDDILLGYSKTIEKAVQSVRTIDEFLSKPEIEEYRGNESIVKSECDGKSIESRPWSKRKPEKSKRKNFNFPIERRDIKLQGKDRLSESNKNSNFNFTRMGTVRREETKKSKITKENDDKRFFEKKDFVSKDSNKFLGRSNGKMRDRVDSWRQEIFETSENSSEDIRRTNINEEFRFSEAGSFRTEKTSTTSTTSSVKQETVNPKAKMFENEEKNIAKNKFDYRTLQSLACSNVLKHVFPGIRNTEELIARVLREETRFVEDETKNILNADEIVTSIVKNLLGTLKTRKESNFGKEDLELFVSENVSSNDLPRIDDRITETANSVSGKQDLQVRNCSAMETIKCDEVGGKTASSRSDQEDIITRNSTDQMSSRNDENVSAFENEKSSLIAETNRNNIESNSFVERSKENSSVKISIEKNDGDGNSEKIISEEFLGKKDGKENLDDRENYEMQRKKEEDRVIDISGKKNDVFPNMDEKIGSSENYNFLEDFDGRISLHGENGEPEMGLQVDSMAVREKILSLENDEVLESEKERSTDVCLISKAVRIVEPFNENFSSSDSLHNCVSLPSSSRSLSNNREHSQEVKEMKETLENKHIIDGPATNSNNSGLDNKEFNREQILVDVYDEVQRKLFSSTFETNYSNVLNHHLGFSSGISTISTTESNRIILSSDNSHSEGEVCLPSSDSYSLGEIRIVAKSRSENESDFDDNISVFVTKEMLTSWNESSKSLIQSMGEI